MPANVILTADIGFGDAGKGSIVEWLVREHRSPLVVRYNGGAQAAHNVVLKDGRHHTFAQFGAGSLSGASTFLSRHVIIAPDLFLNEAHHLSDMGLTNPASLVYVDARCPVASPFHRMANQAQEDARGNARHGSCGLGIGNARADVTLLGDDMLYAGDLLDERKMTEKLINIRAAKQRACAAIGYGIDDCDELLRQIVYYYRVFAESVNIVDIGFLHRTLATAGTVVFEGAQGVLLDQHRGFFPHVTYSDITFRHADELLNECGYSGHRYRLGVTRCFSTRHGAGPFPAEDSRVARWFRDSICQAGEWQGMMRYGWFDSILARYGIAALGGVHGLAVTCLDRLRKIRTAQIVNAYAGASRRWFEFDDDGLATDIKIDDVTDKTQSEMTSSLERVMAITVSVRTDRMVESICDEVGVAPHVLSYGPTAQDKSYAPDLRWPLAS